MYTRVFQLYTLYPLTDANLDYICMCEAECTARCATLETVAENAIVRHELGTLVSLSARSHPRVRVLVFPSVVTYTRLHTSVCACACVCARVCVCACVYLYVYMFAIRVYTALDILCTAYVVFIFDTIVRTTPRSLQSLSFDYAERENYGIKREKNDILLFTTWRA